MTTTILPPPLHPGQQAVKDDPARFKIVAAGRRWGKTSLGVERCFAVSVRGGRTWWTAPNYPMASIGWKVARHLAFQIPRAERSESERLISFPGGGEFQVKSADDPDSLRGSGLDFVVVDEAAYVKEEAWTESLRPALADRRGGALFISTPNGYNWFHGLFEKAMGPGWARWQRPTWDNPRIAPDEIDQARHELAYQVFQQEFGAEFIELAGLKPFARSWIQYWGPGQAVEKLPPHYQDDRGGHPGLIVDIGFDPAISEKDTADRSALVVAGQVRHPLMRGRILILEAASGHWTVWEQCRQILNAVVRWKARTVRVEDVAYQKALKDILDREARTRGVHVHIELVKPDMDKLRRANAWSPLVEDGTILFPVEGAEDLVRCMLAVPTDDRAWDPVDAAGLCIRGFPALEADHQPIDRDARPKQQERAASYAMKSAHTSAKPDLWPVSMRPPARMRDRAKGYAVNRKEKWGVTR
jgi:predicted phage terminase large subunit-like protein